MLFYQGPQMPEQKCFCRSCSINHYTFVLEWLIDEFTQVSHIEITCHVQWDTQMLRYIRRDMPVRIENLHSVRILDKMRPVEYI